MKYRLLGLRPIVLYIENLPHTAYQQTSIQRLIAGDLWL